MPRPTEPVRRICYGDDITVLASGVKNLGKIQYQFDGDVPVLMVNSLLILAPKLSVTLVMPDPAQANTRPKIKIADSELLLVCSSNILGVYLDTFFSFNNHCVQVAKRVSKKKQRIEGIDRHQLGNLRITYKALGRSIANYATPV